MLSCKQASQLISQSLDRRLSGRERWSLRFHLIICYMCTRFSKQLMCCAWPRSACGKRLNRTNICNCPLKQKRALPTRLHPIASNVRAKSKHHKLIKQSFDLIILGDLHESILEALALGVGSALE